MRKRNNNINSILFLLILFINTFISYFILKDIAKKNLFFIINDFFLWLLLYFIYIIIKERKIKFIERDFYQYFLSYLINLFIILIKFLVLGIVGIKYKILANIISFIVFIIIGKQKTNKFYKIIPYIIFFIFSMLFLLLSPLSLLGNKISGTDSSVFRYIGIMINKGKTPYIDLFDHKGPLLYLINWLGTIINIKSGVWFIELLSLFVSLIFGYKICNLFTNKLCSLLSTILSFIPLLYLFEGGNLTEEYAIPFIMISLFLFFKNIKNHNCIKLFDAFIIGMCMGAVLLLRANMVIAWVCMSIYLLITYIKSKKIKELFKLIGAFLLGCIVFVLPFIIYLIAKGAFNDFISEYILFNLKYSSTNGKEYISYLINQFSIKCRFLYLSIVLNLIIFLKTKKYKSIMLFNIFLIITSFVTVILPGSYYLHYAMIMIPTFLLPLAISLKYIYEKTFTFTKNKTVKIMLLIFVTFSLISSDIIYMYNNINSMINANDNMSLLYEVIDENTKKDEEILVFNNNCIVYINSNKSNNLKYFYQLPVFKVDDNLVTDFNNKIKNNKPKLIIIPINHIYEAYEYLPFMVKEYEKLENTYNGYIIYKLNEK